MVLREIEQIQIEVEEVTLLLSMNIINKLYETDIYIYIYMYICMQLRAHHEFLVYW